MTWTRTPQEFPDRADVLAVSRSARWLLMEMYSWSNAQLTNGRVPRGVLRRISDAEDVEADVAELLREELLEERPGEDGLLFLDWSNQEDADTVRERAARNVEKTRRARERKERHAAGDHSVCVAPYCKAVTGNTEGNVTGDAKVSKRVTKTSRNPEVTPVLTPIRSDPIRSVRSKGEERIRAGADSAGAPSGPASMERLHAELPAHDAYGNPRPPEFTDERWARYCGELERTIADLDAADDADAADTLEGLIPAGGAGA